MSQKQFSAADQPESEQPPNSQMNMAAGRRKTSESGQRSEETTFSSTKSGSLNGDAKRNGKSRRRRRRCKERSSNSENGTEKVNNQTKADEKPEENGCRPSSTAPGLSGLQSERANVWFEHSPYEQAESLYQSQLVSSSNVTTQSNCSPPGMVQESQSFSAVTSSSSHLVCHNGDQVACHHIVQQVSVYKTSFDQAESCYVEEYMQTSILNSLDLSSTFNLNCVAPRIPDEGYPSLTATPATPVTQCVAVTPTNQQLINGLPHIPVELPKDVWLENPMYDHAEAAFYENLYNNTSRSNNHPQSLVEVEEDTEADEQEIAAVEEVRVIQQGKVEVFHALHPIQEEAEPVEAAEKEDESGASVCFFLHPDNGRVWLDNGRYDAAESQFYQNRCEKASGVKKERSTGAIAASVSTAATNTNMSTVDNLAQEQIWFEKPRYDEAERRLYEHVYSSSQPQEAQDAGANTILQDIARAQENIQKTLAGSTASSTNANTADQEILSRIKNLELENQSLYKALSKLECRVALLEKTPAAAAAPSVPCTNGKSAPHKSRALVKEEDNDDDIDLFGSDEDDDEAEKLKEQRLKEYVEKKAKKPTLIAKSSILLDVKPWDDETDMVKLEECVRSIQTDGLLWGTSKLVPVGYGIKKLQITCVVEDDKVGTDLLEEEITKFEDFVQSVDVAAFNKI